MTVLFILMPLAVLVAAGFLCAFIWSVRSGQLDDTETPGMRILAEDGVAPKERRSTDEGSAEVHENRTRQGRLSAPPDRF